MCLSSHRGWKERERETYLWYSAPWVVFLHIAITPFAACCDFPTWYTCILPLSSSSSLSSSLLHFIILASSILYSSVLHDFHESQHLYLQFATLLFLPSPALPFFQHQHKHLEHMLFILNAKRGDVHFFEGALLLSIWLSWLALNGKERKFSLEPTLYQKVSFIACHRCFRENSLSAILSHKTIELTTTFFPFPDQLLSFHRHFCEIN